MTKNTFLDKKGLSSLLERLESRYKSRHKIRIDAGLELCKLTPVNGVLTVEDLDNDGKKYFHQGKYYYCSPNDKVSELRFGKYKIVDEKIMGEAAVQFSTGGTVKETISSQDSDPNTNIWIWNNNRYTLKEKNTNYLITVKCNQQGPSTSNPRIFIADQQYYTNPDEVVKVVSNYIKITYNWAAGSSNKPFNDEWLKTVLPNLKCNIYYSSSGSGTVAIGRTYEDLKSLQTAANLKGKPYILIAFEDNNIDLSKILYNISFDTFSTKFDEGSGHVITSVVGAFGADSVSSNNVAGTIDLGGFKNRCRFTNMDQMFKCRKFTSLNISNLDTTNVTSMNEIFYYSSLNDSYSTSIGGWDTRKCCSFDKSFANTSISNTSMIGKWNMFAIADNNSSQTLSCKNMFENCSNINDISGSFNWLMERIEHTSKMVYLSGMFKNCTKYAGSSDKLVITNANNMINRSITFGSMFENCSNMSSVPIIEITGYLEAYFSKMFVGIGTAVSSIDFSNFKKWRIISGHTSSFTGFDYMFQNVNFNKLADKTFIFCDGSRGNFSTSNISKGTWDFRGMFAGTYHGTKYNLYFALDTGYVTTSNKVPETYDPDAPNKDNDHIDDDDQDRLPEEHTITYSTRAAQTNNPVSVQYVQNMFDKNNMDVLGFYYLFKGNGTSAYPGKLYYTLYNSLEYCDYMTTGYREYTYDPNI